MHGDCSVFVHNGSVINYLTYRRICWVSYPSLYRRARHQTAARPWSRSAGARGCPPALLGGRLHEPCPVLRVDARHARPKGAPRNAHSRSGRCVRRRAPRPSGGFHSSREIPWPGSDGAATRARQADGCRRARPPAPVPGPRGWPPSPLKRFTSAPGPRRSTRPRWAAATPRRSMAAQAFDRLGLIRNRYPIRSALAPAPETPQGKHSASGP